MTRAARSAWRWLGLAGGALALVAAVGWIGAWAFYPSHVLQVTGRENVPRVSCLHCHNTIEAPTASRPSGPYLSPSGMVVRPDGAVLFVAAAGADRLLEIDLATGRVSRSREVPGRPHGLAISADGSRLAVSLRERDRVWVLDTGSLELLHEIPAAEPLGVALSRDGSRVYAAAAHTDRLLISDPASPGRPSALVAGNEPYALALSADGTRLAVANRLADSPSPGVVAASEVTLVDVREGRVFDRRELSSAHLSEGIALSRDGSFALASVVRVRNLLPITQVARGAVMTAGIALIETARGGRTIQFPLDEVNAFFADPSDVALTPDDRLAFVAHTGARVVAAVDVGALRALAAEPGILVGVEDDLGVTPRYVTRRIPTGNGPRTLCMSPDGSRLYVAEQLDDTIAVIDTERLAVVDRIDLGGPRRLTAERRGERIFHDASVTFQGQFSCRSCHPDGHTDGLTWDFEIDGIGENLVETRSLRGIRDTAPFKWNGKNPDLTTQCGPRFARVLTRSDPFSPRDLADLVAYINSIPLPPNRLPPEMAQARERGREVFFRTHDNRKRRIPVADRCDTCHRTPLFTDRLKTDVGTGGAFDTPHLFDIGSSAPYLHDGRSATLEEIWTVHSPEDTHGITSDLSKTELNDLITYLRSL